MAYLFSLFQCKNEIYLCVIDTPTVHRLYIAACVGIFIGLLVVSMFIFICLLLVSLTSYSVMQFRGLRLPSNTGFYDRARPGAGSHPSLPQRVLHCGSRPASPSGK